MSMFGKLTIDTIFGNRTQLQPGEHYADLLACLENSDIEGYEDDETNSDSENENFENNENYAEGLGEQPEEEEFADLSSDSHPEFNIINLKARCGRNFWKKSDHNLIYQFLLTDTWSYIAMYIEDPDVENICACTNLKYLLEHDKPMNLSHSKVVVDNDIPEDTKQKDRLWKITPLEDKIRNGCLSLDLRVIVAVDEQIMPFTGVCKVKQFARGKPNPDGLKIFVCATPEGLVLDFGIYQGKGTLLGVGSSATLGNHEFDHEIEGVVPFLEHLEAPVVVANIDDSLEPRIQGLYKKSTIIKRDGRKIGIVGVMLSTTNLIASTENLIFLDESESVNAEAQRLLDEEGVFTVIVLSHSGYDVDQRIAANAIPGISVIVGAHSHTLLYTGTPPLGTAYGRYPTLVNNTNDEPVLIVQASAYTKYLGYLSVTYDGDGNLLKWEGNPIYLDQSIQQDLTINELLEPYRLVVEEVGNRVLGTSKVYLDQGSCRYSECNLGNFMTDAMVAYYANNFTDTKWTKAAIGIVNAGGIRTSISAGDITFNDLATSSPFANTVDYVELQGKYIKELLEKAASPYSSSRVTADVNLLQISGIRMVIDLAMPLGSRVVSLKIRCHECNVPKYYDVDLEAYYPIAVVSFLITGGDGFSAFSHVRNHIEGPVDTDVYTAYIEQQSPIIAGLDERIQIISSTEIKVIYHAP
ncbi:nucleotidase-related [Holotrichia oblita]|uniref:Nucleotidase-related n=1 Tax=Holotrichia oblita TaxID=644536 RepID=A0ACB9SJF5_HOLOL|nr:nucleotidase-related [Holotrichia oblita]